jgi:predicted ATPase
VLAEHRRVLRGAFDHHGGTEVDTQGDAFFVVFRSPRDALAAATEGQAALEPGPVRVRMGVHTGRPTVTAEGYFGLDVHKAARIAASGHGGQVVLSRETLRLIQDPGLVTDLGDHRLKDFEEPVRLFQVGDELFPPLKTISNTNLPRPASSFIGRAREVSEVVSLLRGEARLVTLTGAGGSGKTRLAIEAASELVSDHPAGVFWVGLATLREHHLVIQTIAQTLGVKEALEKHIGEEEMLLLLDNFEQVVEAASELSTVLDACPNLKLLVTSRELLRIRGEAEYAVPPLVNPEAVELFCARARIEPTSDVEELCARLDDLPLAIELAAARTRVLSPPQILQRLGERLDLFRGGRDVDPRQATLRATIRWSHDLLDEKEQRLFARLAVFAGGCTIQSAEEVAGADLDTLQSLVDKSLVRRTDDRFWMLETIREYALERLNELPDAQETRRRHFDHYRAIAGSANLAPDSEGAQRHDLVLAEQDNIRSALDWAAGAGEIEAALRLAMSVEQFWVARSAFEGARRLAALLSAAPQLPDDLRARALRDLAGTLQMSGDDRGAEPIYAESLAIFEALEDEDGIASLLHRLATIPINRGNAGEARPLLDRSLELSRRVGRPRLECEVTASLGFVECMEGNYGTGLDLLRSSAALAREIGWSWFAAGTLQSLAEFSLEAGRPDEALRPGLEGLATSREVGDRQWMIYGLAVLAMIASASGDGRRAGRLWGAIEAEEMRGAVGAWESERSRYEAAASSAGSGFEEGRREGHRLSLDEAVEEALRAR